MQRKRTSIGPVWVAIDVAKNRHEVLVEAEPGSRRSPPSDAGPPPRLERKGPAFSACIPSDDRCVRHYVAQTIVRDPPIL